MVALPVDGCRVGTCLLQCGEVTIALLSGVLLARGKIAALQSGNEISTLIRGEQCAGDTHRARRIGHMDHRPMIDRVNLHRGVNPGGGGAADHQRNRHLQSLQLFCQMNHFVQ